MTNIITLKKEAQTEAYGYFDKNIRELEKNDKGEIKPYASGLVDNDADAFRHAYASGRYTQVYGEKTANILGHLWELKGNSSSENGSDKNMGLWNNFIGRKHGKNNNTKEDLLKSLHKALNDEELIIDPKDPREYDGKSSFSFDPEKPVIVASEKETGRNEVFLDLSTRNIMSREEFVSFIQDGKYPGYTVAYINNIATPMSRPDGSKDNNLG